MDTYEVGNYVRRWGAVDGCHVIDPSGKMRKGNVKPDKDGYFVDLIPAVLGEWIISWRDDEIDRFCVEQRPPDVIPKTIPRLTDGVIELVPLNSEYLEILRAWRNRDDIRRWFFNSDVLSETDQRRWYYSVYLHTPNDYMWIAHLDGKPIGTGALTHIDFAKREAEWARLIVGEDCARGKGLAHRIAALVRDYGLDELKLERIYGALYTANEITMHIDMKAGYMPYKVEDDITHVELLRKDWR